MKKIKNTESLFAAFQDVNVLVIGDSMIDAYLWGKVERISPEAPVPIVSVNKKENRLGGAANVAINLRALGANPILCSVVGDDLNGRIFFDLLQQLELSPEGILQSTDRPTTVKTRVIGNNHQMMRIDEEQEEDITAAERRQLISRIESILKKQKIHVIIFEDYDKGLINKTLIEQVVRQARHLNIPIAADPKKRNFNHYKNIALFKPNLKELREGMKLELEKGHTEEIAQAVRKLCAQHHLDSVLVTLSEKGILLVNGKSMKLIPAHFRNIVDVSGAGDTVISVAALCLALKTTALQMAALANLAGGLVCEKVGVVSISRDELLDEARRLKIF